MELLILKISFSRLQLLSVRGTEKRGRVRVRASELERTFSFFFSRSRSHTHTFFGTSRNPIIHEDELDGFIEMGSCNYSLTSNIVELIPAELC